jgi:NAD(P)-dependent dehydrogenase (short-subunit alcohol dehydrogenase family)
MIIISGASRGVGKYLLDSFVSEGLQVIGLYNKTNPKTNLDNYYKLDVLNNEEIEDFIRKKAKVLTNIILINCVGITYNAYAHKSEPNKWNDVIDVNIKGVFNMIRLLLPIMRDNQFGRIINFSSVVADKHTPGVSAYATSKAGLWGMGKSVSIENASKNITINTINLGYSELGMIGEVPEKFLKEIIGNIPIGRLCKANEILSCVKFLMENSYITGTSIKLNGGLI